MSFVGNRDRCGKCGVRHGGNNHYCSVHGAVSEGCCDTDCDPRDYAYLDNRGLVPISEVPDNATLEKPYKFQDDGAGGYKRTAVRRFVSAT